MPSVCVVMAQVDSHIPLVVEMVQEIRWVVAALLSLSIKYSLSF